MDCGLDVRISNPQFAIDNPQSGRVVRLDEFRSLVARLQSEIPSEFTGGVVAVDVSPKALPHPVHGDVYTLGECVPLEWSGSGADLHSRIILYHGSFASLARLGDFDWREETWETLTHELRHHLEWRAHLDRLEAYDWAAEENASRLIPSSTGPERSLRLVSIRWMTTYSWNVRRGTCNGAGRRWRRHGMGGAIACRSPTRAEDRCSLRSKVSSTHPRVTPSWS